jgi:hypothetical protein
MIPWWHVGNDHYQKWPSKVLRITVQLINPPPTQWAVDVPHRRPVRKVMGGAGLAEPPVTSGIPFDGGRESDPHISSARHIKRGEKMDKRHGHQSKAQASKFITERLHFQLTAEIDDREITDANHPAVEAMFREVPPKQVITNS